MFIVIEIHGSEEQPVEVLRRRLIDGANIQLQGFAARVTGTVDERFEPLLPYLTGRAG